MANITVRNIPNSVFEKLKLLSEIERRSLNNELLIAIESGVKELEHKLSRYDIRVSSETQTALWEGLAGKWKDSKSKEKQIKEIYDARTMGRDVAL
jgi:plasmid stability protein